MANDKINEYVVEATSFNNGSYFDIDQLVAPATWQSQKLPFSAMITQFGNIYNYDGTITEQRTLNGDSKTKGLFFIDLQTFTVRAAALEYESDVDIKLIAGATGALILPSDVDPSANVVTPEEFMVKGNTTSNDLMVYVNGTWENVAFNSDLINIYNADGVVTGDRIIDAGGNNVTFDNVGLFKVENATDVIFDDIANVSFLIQRSGVNVFQFTASSSTNPSFQIGTLFNEEIVIAAKRGLWLNRATTAKEALVAAPQTGLMLINTDVNKLRYYDGAAWQSIAFSTGVQESTTVTTSSGAGAVAITGGRHDISTLLTGDALTLANGSAGQKLKVVYVAETAPANTAILTPTTLLGYTTITFNAIGDSIELEYGTGGWAIIGDPLGATLA